MLYPFNKEYFQQRKNFIKIIFIIILVYTCIYTIIDINQPMIGTQTKYFEYNSNNNTTLLRQIFNKFYYTITTLTTLGLGDIYPIHPLSQFITATQILIIFVLISELITK